MRACTAAPGGGGAWVMDPQWTVPKAVRDKYEERFRRMKNAADVIPGVRGVQHERVGTEAGS